MEGDVFVYFVAIGAGVSLGLTLGAIPGYMIWRWMNRRGEVNHGQFSKKARHG